jgi:6-aminohexanoate-oligomer endohydrolase
VSPVSNDSASLTPRVSAAGRLLEFDFPQLEIGVAEYPDGPTGCTVFHFPAGVQQVADVRGGAPGVLGDGYGFAHAICFAGGSAYGLEACSGVAAELLARRAYRVGWEEIALVSGAIVYDYGPRATAIYPDKALGRAALRAARPGAFPLGARGAGISATVGKCIDFEWGEPSGQGGAFRELGALKLGVFTVVNAWGAIVDRSGAVVRGNLDRSRGERIHAAAELERRALDGQEEAAPPGNTTLTLVVTNAVLAQWELRQLARQTHSSLARAIQPFNALYDGDVLFAVTTSEVESTALDAAGLGVIASEVAWDAVLASVPEEGS